MRILCPLPARRSKASVVVLLLNLSSAMTISAQALFSITEAHFGSYVGSRPKFEVMDEATGGEISRAKLHHALWLTITVIGDAGTMKYLEDNQYLSLEAVIWADGKEWDHVEIGINYSDWEQDGPKLKSQLENQQVFTWRTRMRTTKVDASTIQVKFFDKDNHSLSPLNYPGAYVATIKIK